MEFVEFDPTSALPSVGTARPEQESFRAGEILSAGFRQENDLVNLAQLVMKPAFVRDPSFNIAEALQDNPLVDQYASVLGKAQSQEELDYLLNDVQTELRDKQILASNGFTGFVASAAAGLVSPTSLIPMVGPARGIKGAAQSFALAGGAITAQEAALYGMQSTRTPEEVFTGIAVGTVLGGLLGTAARELSPAARVDLESSMASKRGVTTILHTDPETGATSRIDFDTIAEAPLPAVRTRYLNDPDKDLPGEQVRSLMIEKDGQTVGAIEGVVLRDSSGRPTKELSIYNSNLEKSTRGTGVGVASYEDFIRRAESEGFTVVSDANVSTSAARVYSALQRRGYTVTKNPTAKLTKSKDPSSQAMWRSENEEPVFKITKSPPASKVEKKTDTIANDFDEPTESAIRTSDAEGRQSTIGAKDARAQGRALAKKGPVSGKLIDLLAKLNPVTRLLQQNISVRAKVWMERIQLPGVKLEQMEGVETAAGEGTAYSRSLVHQAAIADFVKSFDDAYARHYHGGKVPEGKLQSAWMETIKSRMGRVPDGKLAYDEFGKTVFELGNTGASHPDPFVNQAVVAFRKYFAYVDDFADRYFKERQLIDGEDATPLYTKQEFGEDSDIQHYIHHAFDNVAVVDQMDSFIRDFANHGEGVMKARFAKAHGTFLTAYSKLTDKIVHYQQDTPALTAQIKAADAMAEQLNLKHVDNLERAATYRDRLVASGMEKQEIANTMKEFRKNLPDDFADDMRRIRETKARVKVLKAAKKMPPARRLQEAEAIKLQRQELHDTFDDLWRKEGAVDLHVMRGEADFKQQALEDATKLFTKISGQQNRIAGIDVLGGSRGPQLQRMLHLPFNIKKKYLTTDPEKIVRMHGYSMFPDLEIYRITGSPNGAKIFDDIREDVATMIQKYDGATHLRNGQPVRRITPQELEVVVGTEVKAKAQSTAEDFIEVLTGRVIGAGKANKLTELTPAVRAETYRKLRKDAKDVENDMRVVIDRMRHSRGVPKDGDDFGYRVGRAAMNANVMRYMGSVAISSVPDMARPVMKFGLGKVFRHAWKPLVSDLGRIKMSRAEAYRGGIALDPLLHNRANAIFDVSDNHALRQTMAERGLEFLSNKTGFVALFDRWTAEMKHMAVNVTYGEFGAAFKNIADGVADPKGRAMIQAAGINDDMARRIWAQFMKEGGSTEFDGGFRLPNTEAWDDFEAVMAMRAGVLSVTDDLIVTPGLDRPNWMDENQAFRMVAQFRSFTFTATNRIIMSGLQEQDMAFMQGAIMSLGLGAISYYTWAASVGGDTWTKAQNAESEQVIYEAFARSGLLGVLSEGQRIGEQIPGLNDWAVFGGEGRPSRRADSVLGAVLGPSYDLAEKLVSVAQGLSDPTQNTLRTARTALVPYQNVFYFRKLLDAMEESLGDALDLPERRG